LVTPPNQNSIVIRVALVGPPEPRVPQPPVFTE
jgi:hypothetical protein